MMAAEQILNDTTELIVAGKIEQALDDIISGIREYPENAQLQFMAGALSAQMEHFDQAINYYQSAVSLNQELYIAKFQLGLFLVTLEQAGEGEQILRTIPENENDYISCFSMAIISILGDDPEQAKTLLQRGMQLNLENASLNSDMSSLLQRLRNEHWDPVLNNEPESPIPKEQLSDDESQMIENEVLEDDTSTHLLDVYKRH